MNNFKVGDWVECVNGKGTDQIRVGDYYKVVDVEESQCRIRILNISGNCYWYDSNMFKLMNIGEQHIKEFLNKLEYVLYHDNTVASMLDVNVEGDLYLEGDIVTIYGADDIYIYINNSYDQLTSQAAQKRKQELLDKRQNLLQTLSEIDEELNSCE